MKNVIFRGLLNEDENFLLKMIIKGAGAGADVTASGLFADIIRAGNE